MIPEVVEPAGLADYLAILSRAIFQAGLSWKLIESRWADYLRLFEGFDPVLVAAFGEADVERIMSDGGVVRTRKKIVATIENARTLLELERSPGGFRAYLGSFASYAELARDLRARFAFVGELSAYYFLFRTGRPVPRFEVWEGTVSGDHPRMREMVALAREQLRSPERDDA
jgi:3-methyladenine DNA glycosylase Tag